MSAEARTYGDELLARAVSEYRDWDDVADPDDVDNEEASAAAALISTLVDFIAEELGDNIHEAALALREADAS